MVSDALASRKRPLRYVMGLVYVVAGVLHFLRPKPFECILPPQLPAERALVYVTGVMEVAFGLGVLFERTRRVSAWGIVVTLLTVFPANIYMASDSYELPGVPERFGGVVDAALYARLPLQAVLVAWAWWYIGEDDD
jgi:uncharacterized membrane protein